MNIAALAGALGLVGTVAGGVYLVEDRYAPKTEVAELAGAVSDLRLSIRLDALQRRLWSLQEKFGPSCGPAAPECRALHAEIDQIKRQMRRR